MFFKFLGALHSTKNYGLNVGKFHWQVGQQFPEFLKKGSWDGTEVRALGSHQCDPGLIPGPGVICGLSLLLILYSALRGFSPGTPVYPSPQNQHS